MDVRILNECGYEEAMLGLGLNKALTSGYMTWEDIPLSLRDKLHSIAGKLSVMDGGHNKFLETMAVWLDMDAPLYFWKQFDTYRVGISKQSESTMHTLMDRHFISDDFEGLSSEDIDRLNKHIDDKDFDRLNKELPQCFKQRRIVCTNYKTLRNIFLQRKTHKLSEWKTFCEKIKAGLKYHYFIDGKK